jgi:Bacterial regulatory proteins, tetR family
MPSPAKVIGPDLTSRHLIDVARSLFVGKGYAATKMDEVASGLNFDPAELADLPVPEALSFIAERFVEFTCQPEAIRLQLVYECEGSQLPEVVAAFERSGPERDIACRRVPNSRPQGGGPTSAGSSRSSSTAPVPNPPPTRSC